MNNICQPLWLGSATAGHIINDNAKRAKDNAKHFAMMQQQETDNLREMAAVVTSSVLPRLATGCRSARTTPHFLTRTRLCVKCTKRQSKTSRLLVQHSTIKSQFSYVRLVFISLGRARSKGGSGRRHCLSACRDDFRIFESRRAR